MLRNYLKRSWEFLSYYVGGLIDRAGEHHIFLMSGGLSFSIFVCILPMILIVFSIIGSVLEKPSIAEDINTFIDKTIPYEDYATYAKDLVSSRVHEFKLYKSLAGVLGMIGLLIASSGLFSSMRTILNSIYKVRSGRSVYVSKLRDVGLVLLVIVYFLLSTTVLPTFSIVENLSDRFEVFAGFSLTGVADVALEVLSFVVILIAFFILYFLMPEQRSTKRALVSAIAAAVLWKFAEYLFGYYITGIATYKRIYGAYSLLIVIAFWIYYTSLVFQIAAVIGQLFREKRDRKLGRTAPLIRELD